MLQRIKRQLVASLEFLLLKDLDIFWPCDCFGKDDNVSFPVVCCVVSLDAPLC